MVRETNKRMISQHISLDSESADWVLESRGLIKKTNLPFAPKFIFLLILHCLSPISFNNILTWYKAVFVAAMVTGFEVDFPRLLLAVIH